MSWSLVKLNDIAKINPRMPKNVDQTQKISFLKMASVSENGEVLEQESRVLSETKKGFTYFERGDVLLAKITPCFENGKAALVNNLMTEIGFGSTEFHVIRAEEKKLDNKYLFYLLWSKYFRFIGKHQMKGAVGQQRISADFLKNIKIPLPPLKTQKYIADILEKADQLRKDCQQMEQELNQLAQSVFIEMFGDPVLNPKGWEIGTIENLLNSANYGTSSKASEEKLQYPVLRMNNITYQGGWNFSSLKYMNLTSKEQKKYLVKKGDLLFNRTNSRELVGKTAVFYEDKPMVFAGYLVRGRCNDKAIPEYISAFMNSKYGKQTLKAMCKSIVGMANINAKEFQKIKIPLAPINIQLEFSHFIQKNNMLLKKQQEELAVYETLFNALSQKAFKGELKDPV